MTMSLAWWSISLSLPSSMQASLPVAAEAMQQALRAMSLLAGLAAAVNAVELWRLHRSRALHAIWRAETLAAEWGLLRFVLRPAAFGWVIALQLVAAAALALAFGPGWGSAATLCVTTWLASVRFRGNVNGGSDGMLFTVLLGLVVAQLPRVGASVQAAGVLYVAAQVTLSYLRAALVKVRQRDWWSGEALRAFLALPAYGAPAWVPRTAPWLRSGSVIVMLFELSAPVAWWNPRACAVFIGVALTFHVGAAVLFGLNRFVWAWGAALPALWYAVHRASP